MTNIPTEVLRTLIAVVDQRSFTKAAHKLGITQPAVSAQIKRLQALLGGELFDKSVPGVRLTEKGEQVVKHARELLAINDEIFDLTTRRFDDKRLRLGYPIDYCENTILAAVAEFQRQHPDYKVQVVSEYSDILLQELNDGDFELVVAVSDSGEPKLDRHRFWPEPPAWAAASPEVFDAEGPIRMIAAGNSSLTRRLGLATLEQAGQPYEVAYVGKGLGGLAAAASAGLGIMWWSKRMMPPNLHMRESSPRLPRLPDLHAGVYLADRLADNAELNRFADHLADLIRPQAAPRGEEPLPSRRAAQN